MGEHFDVGIGCNAEDEQLGNAQNLNVALDRTTPFPIFSLPPEILLVLFAATPYHTLLALRQTHRRFADYIPIRTLDVARRRLIVELSLCEQTDASLPSYLLDLTWPYRDQIVYEQGSRIEKEPGSNIPSTSLLRYLPKHRQPQDDAVIPLPRTIPLSTHVHVLPPQNPPLSIICYTCLLPLPATHFSTRQITGRRRPHGRDAHRRFCIDCAVHSGRWRIGTKISNGATPQRHSPGPPDRFFASGYFLQTRVVCAQCKLVNIYFHRYWKRCESSRICAWCAEEDSESEYINIPHPPLWFRKLRLANYRKKRAVLDAREVEESCRGIQTTSSQGAKLILQTSSRRKADAKDGMERHMRVGRCQRCWAIDHTEREPRAKVDGHPLCEQCLNLALLKAMEVCIV